YEYSTFYATSHHLGSKVTVVENMSTTHNVHMNITNAQNISLSRRSLSTNDFIPPHHRQLICIIESTNQEGCIANIS
ncbi:unnamed protein product, partial [Didymodactylos carnosus]